MAQRPALPKPQKHVPQRMCVVCRQTAAKRTLIRLVRTADQGVQVDPSGKRSGRGAYLCEDAACWQRAINSDVLAKALRTTLTDDDRTHLRAAAARLAAPNPEAS
jgi:predicted RNA-binding protein YlxR (DUF448 family)